MLFQDLNGEILSPVTLKDYLRNITFIMDHVHGDFIIYIDPLFKLIVLYQDMDTKQENVSHTADTIGECSQLLSNSLATGNSMVSVFVLLFYRATCSFWINNEFFLMQMLTLPSREKTRSFKQFN